MSAPTDSTERTTRVRDEIDPPSTRWPRRIILFALVVAVLVSAAFGTRFGQSPRAVDSPLIGQPAPDITLPYLEKEGELSLADLRGDVVVVNFWASWCVPCREEHPALVAAADAYRSSGVTFVGIVYQDQPDQAIAFLDELGRAYDSLLDPDSEAAIEFGVFGVPETYIINAEGTVVGKVTGKSDYQLLSGMIEQTLAGQTPESRMNGDVQAQP